MDLLTESWIDVFTVDGPATLSLLELARNLGDVLDIASSDPLEDAAVLRILMAADLAGDGDLVGWLTSTAGKWELFDASAPFGQNPQLREHVGERTVGPAVTLPYRFAGNGAVLLDHHHNESAVRLTPAAAARALLMRQQFSVGGIQPFPETIFGLKAAKAAVAASRPLVWIDAGNLADTLAANRRPGPVGAFQHSWPGGKPGHDRDRGGQADALTWHARSMLLVPDSDGYVTGLSITEGLRYGDDTDPQLIPHTSYKRKKKSEPYTAWDVHAARPAWRQLLTAYASIDAPGVLAADLPERGRIRLAGLASYQSRLDGPVTGALPVPQISRTEAGVLDTGIGEARTYLIGRVIAAGRILAPSSTPTSPGAWWKRAMPTDSRLNHDLEPVVRSALTGEITVTDAVDAMRALANLCVDEFAGTLAHRSPVAAVAATTPPAPKKEGVTP
ncbi:type I-E CRISPR-associated protein Cse1/CasA [Rhodococcus marinonascens]|uniref:type I-E CRISPR-associated protein Cse1/CasA n=1 Tax=Rhodococcus marinonascens TaxID=38311 RepID=UPI000932DA33|nr:type I-E CRISPR-associated protein Cse1/CasA [Rhodococcus marinonascens]